MDGGIVSARMRGEEERAGKGVREAEGKGGEMIGRGERKGGIYITNGMAICHIHTNVSQFSRDGGYQAGRSDIVGS